MKKCSIVSLLAVTIAFTVSAGQIPVALQPSIFIDISSGYGVGAGEVSTGHQIFSFDAAAGQVLNLAVVVTEVLQGTLSQDDDSILFLFNSSGNLLASNDDIDPGFVLSSLIQGFTVSATGTYYAGVTTYNNIPIFSNGVISGWSDDGGSNIKFELQISATPATSVVPEPGTVGLLGLGTLVLAGLSWRHSTVR
jgi:hypothetical protein